MFKNYCQVGCIKIQSNFLRNKTLRYEIGTFLIYLDCSSFIFAHQTNRNKCLFSFELLILRIQMCTSSWLILISWHETTYETKCKTIFFPSFFHKIIAIVRFSDYAECWLLALHHTTIRKYHFLLIVKVSFMLKLFIEQIDHTVRFLIDFRFFLPNYKSNKKC